MVVHPPPLKKYVIIIVVLLCIDISSSYSRFFEMIIYIDDIYFRNAS